MDEKEKAKTPGHTGKDDRRNPGVSGTDPAGGRDVLDDRVISFIPESDKGKTVSADRRENQKRSELGFP